MPIMYTVALCAGNAYERSAVWKSCVILKIKGSQDLSTLQSWYEWSVRLVKTYWTLPMQQTCCEDTIHSVLLCRHNSHLRAPKKNVVWQMTGNCDIVAQGCRDSCKACKDTQSSSWPLPHHINEQRREGKQLCVYRQMMGTYYTLQQDFSALICHRNFKYL